MRPRSRRSAVPTPRLDRPLLALLDEFAADPLPASAAIRVDSKIGSFLVHADDEVMTPFIQWYREWEPDEAAWIQQALSPGATMLDVGANIGYFARLAGQTVGPEGRVIAIEPEHRNLKLLRHNVWDLDNVTIVPVAAWHERDTLELRFNDANAGDHQVHPAQADGGAGVLVPAIPLDELLQDVRVDVVKIDTQGADHHVVAGLSATLAANPQAQLLVEFWLDSMDERGDQGAAVLEGYRAFGRPIAILGEGGASRPASDQEILETAEGAEGRFVNLVVGAR